MKIRIYSQSFKHRIIRDLWRRRFQDVYYSIILRCRVTALRFYLNRLGIFCKLKQQYRSKEIAHRWSTAYHIANGDITRGDLRKLKDGKDQDGNLWYKRDWDTGGQNSISAKTVKNILENAMKMGPRKMVYAQEGYENDDPRRCPNLKHIPISKHVCGRAIDVEIDWSLLGGAWSTEADFTISQFGLFRPHRHEDWHFELDRNRKILNPVSLLFKGK